MDNQVKRVSAVNAVNKCQDKKRLIQLHERVLLSFMDTNPLIHEDLEKYATAFHLSHEIMLDLFTFVKELWSRCIYFLWKASVLEEKLKEYGINDDSVLTSLVQLWACHGKTVIEKIKSRSTASESVQDVQWSVNVDICTDKRLGVNEPMGLIDFKVDSQGKEQQMGVELNQQDLMKLFNALESVQVKLDSLMS